MYIDIILVNRNKCKISLRLGARAAQKREIRDNTSRGSLAPRKKHIFISYFVFIYSVIGRLLFVIVKIHILKRIHLSFTVVLFYLNNAKRFKYCVSHVQLIL